MATTIRFGVPYQITVRANDIGSGKVITNSFFYRATGSSATPVPAYGDLVAGGGDVILMLNNFITLYAGLLALLNHNYSTIDYTSRAIVGKRFSTPSLPITGMISSLTKIITTGLPHGFTTGDLVNVYGVTTPSNANGLWVITVISPTSFSLDGSTPFTTWSGDGYYQRGSGKHELLYDDLNTVANVAVGGVAGDALPLFVSASVRRISASGGRHFRSRLSFSPMSESDSVDGGWVSGTKTAWATALNNFLTGLLDNGSTDPGQSVMSDFVVSPTLALGNTTPFTSAANWTSVITSYVLQRNSGSIVRRKPRLTVTIT